MSAGCAQGANQTGFSAPCQRGYPPSSNALAALATVVNNASPNGPRSRSGHRSQQHSASHEHGKSPSNIPTAADCKMESCGRGVHCRWFALCSESS